LNSNWKKLLGFRNMQEKLEKICSFSQRVSCVAAQKTDKSLEQSSNKSAANCL
jgi:hypothetical protein